MKNCVICGTKHTRNSNYCSKRCGDKAYRLRKKAELVAARPVEIEAVSIKAKKENIPVVETPKDETPKVEKVKIKKSPVTVVTIKIDRPLRLFWNRRFEEKNSSCAKVGTELTLETISEGIYRIRRGKRNFFTNKEELAKSGIEKL